MKFNLHNKLFFSVAFSLLISTSFAQEELAMLVNGGKEEIPTVMVERGESGIYQDAIPKKLTRKFKRDAARLALRMESKKEDLRYLILLFLKETLITFTMS